MFQGARTIMKIMQPPASLFIFILLGAMLMRLKYRKWGKGLILFGFSMLFILSTNLVAHILVSPLEKQYGAFDETQKNIHAVIVLNSGMQDLSNMGLGERPTSESLTRLVHGVQVYKKLRSTKLVISGRLGGALAKTTIDLGVKRDDLIWEDRSSNTYEGALNLKTMIGEKKIVLVTNARHMGRAVSLHEKVGFEVIPSPSHYINSQISYSIDTIIPSASRLWLSSEALYEYFTRMWYGLKNLIYIE